MSRQDKEELIKSWKEGEVAGPAGDVELDDSALENVSGGRALENVSGGGDTLLAGTLGDCCGGTEGSTCEVGTSGCCGSEISAP